MRRLLTATEAKALDRYTIGQIGVPSVVLMERASLAVAGVCEELLCEVVAKEPDRKHILNRRTQMRILCVCAMGNNGADGVTVARILHLKGYRAEILLVGDEHKATDEMNIQLSIARNLGIGICKADEGEEYIKAGAYDIVVDAIFGVGLTREVTGIYAQLICRINESGAKVVAVDIPSGISADDGKIMGCAVKADVTVTFGNEKLGMILYPGTEYCGRRVIVDIGLAEEQYLDGSTTAITYDKSDMDRLPVRPAYSNKGTFGRVLVVAGSENMGGAALFSGMAAYRMGAGLVEIATMAENRSFLMERLPECVLTIYSPEEKLESWLPEAVERAKAVVVGPGMGIGKNTEKILAFLLRKTDIPLIIDADGLNVLAGRSELSGHLSERVILTPHLGEMSRLTDKTVKQIQRDLIGTAREYSKHTGAVCVMKDARTIVAAPDGRIYVNTSGNCGMATGGSGDLLAGMLGALLAEGMDPFESACLSVYLHGLYGDKARERYGARTMIATDFGQLIGGEI